MKQICIGKIAAAHGIKGLVKILPFGDDLDLLNGTLTTGDGKKLSIALKNPLGKYILAEIEGVHDRNGAEALRGLELLIDRTALPALEENTFYITDLIGMKVTENGAMIGTLIGVDNFGAGDLLDIKLTDGQSFYLPFKDEYVGEIGETIEIKNYEPFAL